MAGVVPRSEPILLGGVHLPAGGQLVQGVRAPVAADRGRTRQSGGRRHGVLPPRDDVQRFVGTS